MSSPIHHADDIDPALVYAPPWVRDRARAGAKGSPATPPIQAPPRLRRPTSQRHASSGDLAMARLQQQLALNPDKVPEPPFDDRRNAWPLVRRVCAVSSIAALIAWGVVLLPTIRRSTDVASHVNVAPPVKETPHVIDTPQVNEVPPVNEAPPITVTAVPTINRVKTVHVTAAGNMPPAVGEMLTPQNEPHSTAESTPESSPAAALAEQNVSTLAGDELATLVKRGQDYLTNGDFASARLLLRRAAEAGSADAALALGATFDPLVIARLGAIGAEPDIGRARKWYETASKLGSQAASQELAKLADTQR
jgi:hypothetical protein